MNSLVTSAFVVAGCTILAGCQPLNAVGAVFAPQYYYRMTLELDVDSKPLLLTDSWRCGPLSVDRYIFNAGPSLALYDDYARESIWIIENRKAIAIATPKCGSSEVASSKYFAQIKFTDDYRDGSCYEIFYPGAALETSRSGRISFKGGKIVEITEKEYKSSHQPYNANLDQFRWATKPPKCPKI